MATELPPKDGKLPVLARSDEGRDSGFESVASLSERIALHPSVEPAAPHVRLGLILGKGLTAYDR